MFKVDCIVIANENTLHSSEPVRMFSVVAPLLKDPLMIRIKTGDDAIIAELAELVGHSYRSKLLFFSVMSNIQISSLQAEIEIDIRIKIPVQHIPFW